MLELKNVSFEVKTETEDKAIVRDVSFCIEDNKFVVITTGLPKRSLSDKTKNKQFFVTFFKTGSVPKSSINNISASMYGSIQVDFVLSKDV